MKKILFLVSLLLLVSCATKKHDANVMSQPSVAYGGSTTGGVGATYPAQGLDDNGFGGNNGEVATISSYENTNSVDLPVVDNNVSGSSQGVGVGAVYGSRPSITSANNNLDSSTSSYTTTTKTTREVTTYSPKITTGYFGAINGGSNKSHNFLYLGSSGREGYYGALNMPRGKNNPGYFGGVSTAYAKVYNPEIAQNTYYGASYNANNLITNEQGVNNQSNNNNIATGQVVEVVKPELASSTTTSTTTSTTALNGEVKETKSYTYTYHGSKESSDTPISATDSIIEQNKENASLANSNEYPKASYGWNEENNRSKTPNTADCEKAKSEVASASKTEVLADKLFYYRKALRLCPESAEYHNGLGEVFLILNRKDDAEMEFQEALKIDPTLESAQNNLKIVRNGY